MAKLQEHYESVVDQITKITPKDMPFISFARDIVIPKGLITLPISTGKVPNRVIYMIGFLIVGRSGTYNIILASHF